MKSIQSRLDDLRVEFWGWKKEVTDRSGWNNYTFKKIVSIIKEIYMEFVELFDKATREKSLDRRDRRGFKKDLKEMAKMLDFCVK